MSPVDLLGRPLGSLRLSVTDRCNMRCRYCMPADEYAWLPRSSLLTYEEMTRLARIFIGEGVRKIRLTGGEPLLRHDLNILVELLAAVPGVEDLALTTNGVLLARHAEALRTAGLRRLTISLDTLRPDRMRRFAKSDRHADVLAGIAAAQRAGFHGTKLNAVIIRGFNDDELTSLVAFGRSEGIEVRFIEYMDVGGATEWRAADVLSRREILQRIGEAFGPAVPVPGEPRAPADRFRLPDGTVFGVVASTTAPFCQGCDRSRVTADGHWFSCLYAGAGVDLREPLRSGRSDADVAELIRRTWSARRDRGAEERAALADRGALYALEGLRADPHREMHTRGG